MATKLKPPVLNLPSLSIECRASTPTVDQATNTVTFSALDASWIERYDWWAGERYLLQFDLSGADLSRVTSGVAMFTDGHNEDRRIGKLIDGSVDGNKLMLTARIGSSDWGQRYLQEVADNVEPGKSIEATVQELETIEEATYDGKGYDAKLITPAKVIARKFQITAVSTVSTPAIGTVGFSASSEQLNSEPLFRVKLNKDPGFRPIQASPVELIKEKNNPMPPEIDDTQRISQLESDVSTLTQGLAAEKLGREKAESDRDKLEQKLTLSNSWVLLRQKAESLMLTKKLSKHEFDELFSGDAASTEVLLSASNPILEIELLTRSLTRIESRSPSTLPTELKTGGELLTQDDDEATKAKARADAYFKSQPGVRPRS